MSTKYHKDRITNPISRRIFRTRITRAENVSAAALIVVIVVAGIWVLAQRDNYDPGERDISIDALQEGSIAEVSYRAPLVRWREPGSGGGPAASGPDLGVFPPGLVADGWAVDGRVETYDPSNLYEKIDGQAEQYLKFGFVRLHYVTLAMEPLYLTVELYDQGRFQNALGVFASQRDPARAVETQGPLRFYRTAVGAIGLVQNYFFKITASAVDPKVEAKTTQLLGLLPDLAAGGGGAAAPFDLLAQKLGVPFGDISYEKENVFQYEFLSDTWFGALSKPKGARIFLHQEADATAVASLFGKLVAEQRQEYAVKDESKERALMRHEFLGTWFAAAHRGRWLFGVEGAQDEASLRRLLARIEKELS